MAESTITPYKWVLLIVMFQRNWPSSGACGAEPCEDRPCGVVSCGAGFSKARFLTRDCSSCSWHVSLVASLREVVFEFSKFCSLFYAMLPLMSRIHKFLSPSAACSPGTSLFPSSSNSCTEISMVVTVVGALVCYAGALVGASGGRHIGFNRCHICTNCVVLRCNYSISHNLVGGDSSSRASGVHHVYWNTKEPSLIL